MKPSEFLLYKSGLNDLETLAPDSIIQELDKKFISIEDVEKILDRIHNWISKDDIGAWDDIKEYQKIQEDWEKIK